MTNHVEFTPDYTLLNIICQTFLFQYIVVHMNVCDLKERNEQIVLGNWQSMSNYEMTS